ncbi:hypothetical protein [Pedobacter sp. MR22-3]|uniref:HU domain-containing protein n=1 Tax=Pedobacter sp. MR22-3 TaxID=2994552 RepID=UPI0022470C28|nr:hypothetical protein [Pedobacter sp. MR22-3]MCX2583544.1 hypothetical protein [Pedobacter sp. MR22-3]
MDILSYLFELLQQRKEVGIAGLGTFFKKKYPGRYDKEKQSFLPPGFTLHFTPEVKEENILEDYVAAKRNISVESAGYYISKFVEETNLRLEEEHEAILDRIGRLYFTEHAGLSFDPAENITYGSEFFGLPALSENNIEEVKPAVDKTEEEVNSEIPDKTVTSSPFANPSYQHPAIENIEPDEVKDDFKHTLKHTIPAEEVKDTPEFIKEQHAAHPNRFGHTPESEEAYKEAVQQANENTSQLETPVATNAVVPDETAISETDILQPVPHSGRFSLRADADTPKTYLHLDENTAEPEPVIDAPSFIKAQHAEHPNRFGHDPILSEEETPQGMSTWLKITIAVLIVIIAVAITYLIKPELFTGQISPAQPIKTVTDTAQVTVDPAKARQDSAAKTDSILKVNQVQKKTDSLGKLTEKPVVKPPVETPKESQIPVNTGPSTFNVIAASFQSEKKALVFIKQMEKIGLKAEIAKLPGRLKKVSIASFKTQKEAEVQKEILQKKLKGKGFFVQQIFTNTQP